MIQSPSTIHAFLHFSVLCGRENVKCHHALISFIVSLMLLHESFSSVEHERKNIQLSATLDSTCHPFLSVELVPRAGVFVPLRYATNAKGFAHIYIKFTTIKKCYMWCAKT